ncbi:MAG: D-amino acid dehydrogenase [Ectothiorhodospiraceae bacterium]|nr:D-amino acid dehydrogenase [Ectothiorhodospiraceae bacterium]
MRILVMGAGVVGVTTAWQLAKDGHEVVVVERHAEAADDTSFGNAGAIAPGHAYAWSSPKAPMTLLRSLWRDDQALRFRFSLDPKLWSWSLAFLRECSAERYRRNTQTKHRLCTYSKAVLGEVVDETGIEYDRVRGGILYVYRDRSSFEQRIREMQILTSLGEDLRELDPEQVVATEPALAAARHRIAGAIHAAGDETGDCRKFTQALAARCVERGVVFHYETTVQRLEVTGDRVECVRTDRGEMRADAHVVALGYESPRLCGPLGIRLPIYPVKGYSVTLPIGERHAPPALNGIDENNLCAFTRMGERLRVTATAEFAGYDKSYRASDFTHMLGAIRDLLPEAADYSSPEYWAGLRPMTPDNCPFIGRGIHHNLYLNTGHGHIGWTMSNGSARIVADLIAGRAPAIDMSGLGMR